MWLIREKNVEILWAGKDWLYPAKYLKVWKEYFPKAKVTVLPDAGRMITEECPDLLLERIKEFMKYQSVTENMKKENEEDADDIVTYHEYFQSPGTGRYVP